MKMEAFLYIEVNTSQIEVNTCFAILLSEIEVITHTHRSKCIFSEPYQITVFCSLKQPKQKRPRGFSLPEFQVAIGGSKSVEKTILQQRPLGATS